MEKSGLSPARILFPIFLATLLVAVLPDSVFGLTGTSDSAPSNSNASNSLGSITFTKTALDSDGTRYLLGEVENHDTNGSVESVVYFGKSGIESAYYTDYIGLVGPGMGMPFKIALTTGEVHLNESDVKVESFPTQLKSNESLMIDYDSLAINRTSHAISGILDNTSPFDAHEIRVKAIAMDSHSQILDVVQSDVIDTISANGSAPFVLVPMNSIASKVAVYSCFVPSQSGQNITLSAVEGQNITLQVYGDGKIRNMKYDSSAHSISFDAQGIFPGGGSAVIMMTSGPPEIMNSSLAVALNGQNATHSLVSSEQVSPGKFYKHVEVAFPFGRNSVTISSSISTPEFPGPLVAMLLSTGSLVLASRWFLCRNKGFGIGT